MKPFFRSYPVSAIPFVATVILLFVGVWNSWNSRREVISSVESLGTFEVQTRNLESLLSSLKEVESAQRGYLLTADDSFLARYQSELERVDELITVLDKPLDSNVFFTETWERITGSIALKTETLAGTLAERKAKGLQAALLAIKKEDGKEIMDTLRVELDRIISHNDKLSDDAREKVQRSLTRSSLAVNLVALATVAAGIMGILTLVGAVRSKAERFEMERDMKKAEKADREKSRFLANMSHEIRTPLNAMLGFGELLEDHVDNRRAKKYLAAIRSSGESLANLINDILDLSKVESGVLELEEEPVIIEEFARSIHLMFHQRAIEAGVSFDVEVDSSCPDFLEIDPLRVRQILTNLLGNAFKFTKAGSVSVKFSAEAVAGSEEAVIFNASVSDTGRGIPPNKLGEIFKPFKQVEVEDENKGGTGLGLSICRKLANMMNGNVVAESTLGEGATFTLILHETKIAVKPERTGEELKSDSNLSKFKPAKILVVDDNPFNRELVAGYFHDTGHEMAYAVNGEDGVEEALRFKPDIILMDIRMPVMDGKEAYRLIRSKESIKDTAVLAVTASSLIKQERQLRKEFDAYLRKPFSRAQLVQVLEKILPLKDADYLEALAAKSPAASSDGAKAPPSDPEKWKGLGKQLRRWRDERLPDLQASMVLGDVASFGEELKDLAKEYNCDFLADYAASLTEHANHFELSAVEKSLKAFSENIDRIASSTEDS